MRHCFRFLTSFFVSFHIPSLSTTPRQISFFKNADMRTLDDDIGDLGSLIKDKETLLLAGLEDEILDSEAQLRSAFSCIADLDCVLSLARVSKACAYTRPEIAPPDEKSIEIHEGRHPLQELISDRKFVANDTKVNAAERIAVITGPNFSGKSCYARQVGLLVYMAQIGCFLPCEFARISIADQILARFSSCETCAVPQSSFQTDLTQLGGILRRSTPDTLVIVDEFGKGT
jgi:DNA mismatch repair protein MSH5